MLQIPVCTILRAHPQIAWTQLPGLTGTRSLG